MMLDSDGMRGFKSIDAKSYRFPTRLGDGRTLSPRLEHLTSLGMVSASETRNACKGSLILSLFVLGKYAMADSVEAASVYLHFL